MAAVAIAARRSRPVLFALALTVLPLLPALYLPALGPAVLADRLLYPPSAGFALIAALALRPDHPEARANLGLALLDAGRIDEGLRECERALAANPDLPEAHHNPGIGLIRKGMIEPAIAELRIATELDPKRALYRDNLARALSLARGPAAALPPPAPAADAADEDRREPVRPDAAAGSRVSE
jgi:tetratricopeptide (TPR) repeat protein